MFVYRKYNIKDVYNDRHIGYEVGFFYNVYDDGYKCNLQKFNAVKRFVNEQEAAEYCHWLNGGTCYKYDNSLGGSK